MLTKKGMKTERRKAMKEVMIKGIVKGKTTD